MSSSTPHPPHVDKKKVLGRGLASLIPDAQQEYDSPPVKKEFIQCEIEKIVANTYQPRKVFDKDSIEELVSSIKVHGVIQPLIVRRKGNYFELIAGERRWRAAQRAGLSEVPVVIKNDIEDRVALEMAIVENIQRQDLNPIEEAIAYQQLIDEFSLSQEEVADKVGKNRSTISNILRILKLPLAIREAISHNKLTMGHARAILSLESSELQNELFEMIIKKKLSVREAERKAHEFGAQAQKKDSDANGQETLHIRAFESELKSKLGLQVKIIGNNEKGFIQICYSKKAELMKISDLLLQEAKEQ